MTEETVVAAPSAAEEAPVVQEMDRSRGPLVDLSAEQRSEYKRTGQLPKAPEPKKEAPAPSPEPKGEETKSESEPEADAGTKQQEKPKEPAKRRLDAQGRVRELRAAIEQEWEKEAPDHDKIARYENTIDKIEGHKRKAEPAPANETPKTPANQPPRPPQNYQEWKKTFKPQEWNDQFLKANPEASWEEMEDARQEFLADVRDQFKQAAERQRAGLAQMNSKLEDARSRYGERFDEVLDPTLRKLAQVIQPHTDLWDMMENSDVLPHVLYVMGSEDGGAEKFLAMSPGQRARWFALNESLVREQLEAKAAPKETPKADPPAPPKTNAPKPPTEVGGRAASPGDEVDSAVRAGDYRRASAEWTRRAIASMK